MMFLTKKCIFVFQCVLILNPSPHFNLSAGPLEFVEADLSTLAMSPSPRGPPASRGPMDGGGDKRDGIGAGEFHQKNYISWY